MPKVFYSPLFPTRLLVLPCLLVSLMSSACLQNNHQEHQSAHQAPTPDVEVESIVSVYDADTFRAALKDWPGYLGDDVGIRVRGVDAPEIRGQCESEKQMAKEARDFVKSKLSTAKSLVLTNVETGKYFRLIADVYIDGDLLSNTLIQAGYARAYDGGRRLTWC